MTQVATSNHEVQVWSEGAEQQERKNKIPNTGELGLSVKCSLCKHEDLSTIGRTHTEILDVYWMWRVQTGGSLGLSGQPV